MNRPYIDADPELSQYIKVILRYKKTVFLIIAASLCIALCLVLFLPRVFEATAIVRMGYVAGYPVDKEAAITAIDYDNDFNAGVPVVTIKAEEIKGRPDLLKIRVLGPDSRKTCAIANALADSFVEEGRCRYTAQINLIQEQIQEQIKEIESEKLKDTDDTRSFFGNFRNRRNRSSVSQPLIERIYSLKASVLDSRNYEIIAYAVPPSILVKPHKRLIIAIALNIGLFAGIFIAFLKDHIKHTSKRHI